MQSSIHRILCAVAARLAMLAIAGSLGACGGGGGGDSPAATAPPPPPVAASSPIGPDQTHTVVISGPAGASVSVPAGAASAPVTVVVAAAGSGAPALPDGATAGRGVFEITPHGQGFLQPVDVAIPFDPASIPAGQRPILLKAELGGDWKAITDVTVDGSTLHANVADFSYFAVVNCAAVAASTCASGPAISIGVAAPTISSAPSAVLSTPPLGSAPNVVAVANDATNVQLAVHMTLPAACLNPQAGLFFAFFTSRETFRPVSAPDSYDGTNPDFVVVGERTFSGEAVVDLVAYVSFSAILVADGTARSVTAVVTCSNLSKYRIRLESAPVYFLSGMTTDSLRAGALAPVAIFESPSDVAARVGQTATFFVSATDRHGEYFVSTSYQWERSSDGGSSWLPIPGAIGARHEVEDVRLDDNGLKFRCIVTRVTSQSEALGTPLPPSVALSDAATLTVTAAAPPIDSSTPWQAESYIAQGSSATFAIKTDGTLWSWGADNGGVLGRVASGNGPARVDGPTDVRSVVSGGWYAVARLGNGDVYAWGWGGNVGTAIGSSSLDNPAPVKVAALSNIRALATRFQHTLALDATGHVFGFGPEASGALGLTIGNDGVRPIAGLAGVRQIAAGDTHSVVLLADGTVWAWGSNSSGQLGVALDTTSRATPAAVPGLTDVIAIAASSFGSFALRRDGSVWSWGQGSVLGRTGPAFVPTPVDGLSTSIVSIGAGNYNVFAIDVSGHAFGWGDNASGRVGVGSDATSIAVPTALPGLPAAAQVTGGESVGAALTQDGRFFTWGSNGSLQLTGLARADANAPVDTRAAR